jgi:hypothetical protein
MEQDILKQDISDLFGLDDMAPEEQEEFLNSIGSLVMESVVHRLMVGMEKEEQKEFAAFVSEIAGGEDMMERLEKQYPEVTQLFEEEIANFKKEAVAVLAKREEREKADV